MKKKWLQILDGSLTALLFGGAHAAAAALVIPGALDLAKLKIIGWLFVGGAITSLINYLRTSPLQPTKDEKP